VKNAAASTISRSDSSHACSGRRAGFAQ
jgi:hypothetical protein